MGLKVISKPDYSGKCGLEHIREIQLAMAVAIEQDDWQQIRRLDRVCGLAIERVIQASRGDLSALRSVLKELKGTYSQLIMKCKCEEQAIAI